MTDHDDHEPHDEHFHDEHDDASTTAYHAPGDDSQWAFGTDFEDPLAGVDTTVPDGVDPATLAAYCLMLGDDALVYSHRLSEWCSRAPDLEEDIALANIALDLLGQARLLLARAAAADPASCRRCRRARRCRRRTRWRSSATTGDFRNVRLVEPDNGDFARDDRAAAAVLDLAARAAAAAGGAAATTVLAAIAAKGVKEVDLPPRLRRPLVPHARPGHRGVAPPAAWPRSTLVWPLHDELFAAHPVEPAVAASGRRRRPGDGGRRGRRGARAGVLGQRRRASRRRRRSARSTGGTGRDGRHTEALGTAARRDAGRSPARTRGGSGDACRRRRRERARRGRGRASPTRRCRC